MPATRNAANSVNKPVPTKAAEKPDKTDKIDKQQGQSSKACFNFNG